MPQLSLYIDKETLEIVEKMAKIKHTSISKWVCQQLRISVRANWPDGYFDNFGALAHVDYPEISHLSFENDIKRELL